MLVAGYLLFCVYAWAWKICFISSAKSQSFFVCVCYALSCSYSISLRGGVMRWTTPFVSFIDATWAGSSLSSTSNRLCSSFRSKIRKHTSHVGSCSRWKNDNGQLAASSEEVAYKWALVRPVLSPSCCHKLAVFHSVLSDHFGPSSCCTKKGQMLLKCSRCCLMISASSYMRWTCPPDEP